MKFRSPIVDRRNFIEGDSSVTSNLLPVHSSRTHDTMMMFFKTPQRQLDGAIRTNVYDFTSDSVVDCFAKNLTLASYGRDVEAANPELVSSIRPSNKAVRVGIGRMASARYTGVIVIDKAPRQLVRGGAPIDDIGVGRSVTVLDCLINGEPCSDRYINPDALIIPTHVTTYHFQRHLGSQGDIWVPFIVADSDVIDPRFLINTLSDTREAYYATDPHTVLKHTTIDTTGTGSVIADISSNRRINDSRRSQISDSDSRYCASAPAMQTIFKNLSTSINVLKTNAETGFYDDPTSIYDGLDSEDEDTISSATILNKIRVSDAASHTIRVGTINGRSIDFTKHISIGELVGYFSSPDDIQVVRMNCNVDSEYNNGGDSAKFSTGMRAMVSSMIFNSLLTFQRRYGIALVCFRYASYKNSLNNLNSISAADPSVKGVYEFKKFVPVSTDMHPDRVKALAMRFADAMRMYCFNAVDHILSHEGFDVTVVSDQFGKTIVDVTILGDSSSFDAGFIETNNLLGFANSSNIGTYQHLNTNSANIANLANIAASVYRTTSRTRRIPNIRDDY